MTSAPEQRSPSKDNRPDEPELPQWLQRAERFPQVDPVVLLGFGPVAIYLFFDRVWDVRPAIAGAVLAAVVVFFVQRRLRPNHKVVFRLAVLGLAILIAFGVLGLIRDDGKVFWASDPIEDFIVGAIFAVSLVLRRPIVAPVIRELLPEVSDKLPADHRVWMRVTAVWTVKILLAGALRLWLLDSVDASTYAILRWPLGWAMNLVLFAWSAHAISGAIRDHALQQLRWGGSDEGGQESSDDVGEVVAESEVAER